ncbi:streptococcal hemagglutinin-like isoform X3 [Dermacentor albipictus]|uniref:streptococcal hemagglutinin-like isoform X3 n=1 Tax=Dermacentor albipictus TaxID=60249 RepID=UPI0031FDDD78
MHRTANHKCKGRMASRQGKSHESAAHVLSNLLADEVFVRPSSCVLGQDTLHPGRSFERGHSGTRKTPKGISIGQRHRHNIAALSLCSGVRSASGHRGPRTPRAAAHDTLAHEPRAGARFLLFSDEYPIIQKCSLVSGGTFCVETVLSHAYSRWIRYPPTSENPASVAAFGQHLLRSTGHLFASAPEKQPVEPASQRLLRRTRKRRRRKLKFQSISSGESWGGHLEKQVIANTDASGSHSTEEEPVVTGSQHGLIAERVCGLKKAQGGETATSDADGPARLAKESLPKPGSRVDCAMPDNYTEAAITRTQERGSRISRASPVSQRSKKRCEEQEHQKGLSRSQSRSPLSGRSSSRGVVDRIIEDMNKAYPRVPSGYISCGDGCPLQKEAGSEFPRSPMKCPPEDDWEISGKVAKSAILNRMPFSSHARQKQQTKKVCVMCKRRDISDSGGQDTCIRCSLCKAITKEQAAVKEQVGKERQAAPEPDTPTKLFKRRSSSDVENRERDIRKPACPLSSRSDDRVKVDTASFQGNNHRIVAKKRARKTYLTKPIISSSDESSSSEDGGSAATATAVSVPRQVKAAVSPSVEPRQEHENTSSESRRNIAATATAASASQQIKAAASPSVKPWQEHEKTSSESRRNVEKNLPLKDGSQNSEKRFKASSNGSKVSRANPTLQKKKINCNNKEKLRRKVMKQAWKNAKDTDDYLRALNETPKGREPMKTVTKNTESEECENCESVKDDIADTETASLEQNNVSSDIDGFTSDSLISPGNPALVVASCCSLSLTDWEDLKNESEIADGITESIALTRASASSDSSPPGGKNSNLATGPEKCAAEAGSSPIVISDFSGDELTEKGCNAAKKSLMGLPYLVRFEDDGAMSVIIQDGASGGGQEELCPAKDLGVLAQQSQEVSFNSSGTDHLASSAVCLQKIGTTVVPEGGAEKAALSKHGEPKGSSVPCSEDPALSAEQFHVSRVANAQSCDTDGTGNDFLPCSMGHDLPTGESMSAIPTNTKAAALQSSYTAEGTVRNTSLSNAGALVSDSDQSLLHVIENMETSCTNETSTAKASAGSSYLQCAQQPASSMDQSQLSIAHSSCTQLFRTNRHIDRNASLQSYEDHYTHTHKLALVPAKNSDIADFPISSDTISLVDNVIGISRAATSTIDKNSADHHSMLHGLLEEYVQKLENFLAALNECTSDYREKLVGTLLPDCFAKLKRMVQLVWRMEAKLGRLGTGRVLDLDKGIFSLQIEYAGTLSGTSSVESDLPPFMSFEVRSVPHLLTHTNPPCPDVVEGGEAANSIEVPQQHSVLNCPADGALGALGHHERSGASAGSGGSSLGLAVTQTVAAAAVHPPLDGADQNEQSNALLASRQKAMTSTEANVAGGFSSGMLPPSGAITEQGQVTGQLETLQASAGALTAESTVRQTATGDTSILGRERPSTGISGPPHSTPRVPDALLLLMFLKPKNSEAASSGGLSESVSRKDGTSVRVEPVVADTAVSESSPRHRPVTLNNLEAASSGRLSESANKKDGTSVRAETVAAEHAAFRSSNRHRELSRETAAQLQQQLLAPERTMLPIAYKNSLLGSRMEVDPNGAKKQLPGHGNRLGSFSTSSQGQNVVDTLSVVQQNSQTPKEKLPQACSQNEIPRHIRLHQNCRPGAQSSSAPSRSSQTRQVRFELRDPPPLMYVGPREHTMPNEAAHTQPGKMTSKQREELGRQITAYSQHIAWLNAYGLPENSQGYAGFPYSCASLSLLPPDNVPPKGQPLTSTSEPASQLYNAPQPHPVPGTSVAQGQFQKHQRCLPEEQQGQQTRKTARTVNSVLALSARTSTMEAEHSYGSQISPLVLQSDRAQDMSQAKDAELIQAEKDVDLQLKKRQRLQLLMQHLKAAQIAAGQQRGHSGASKPRQLSERERYLQEQIRLALSMLTARSADQSSQQHHPDYASFQKLPQYVCAKQSCESSAQPRTSMSNSAARISEQSTPSESNTRFVRPWTCDSQWPYPYSACQEAVQRWKRQQENVIEPTTSVLPQSATVQAADEHRELTLVQPQHTVMAPHQAAVQQVPVEEPNQNMVARSDVSGWRNRVGILLECSAPPACDSLPDAEASNDRLAEKQHTSCIGLRSQQLLREPFSKQLLLGQPPSSAQGLPPQGQPPPRQ